MAGNNKSANRAAANNSNNSGNNANTSKSQKRRARRQRNGSNGGGPPTAVGAGYVAQGPAIVGGPRGSVRFSNTEYVADVTAAQPGSQGPVVAFNINPSNQAAFPWLSRIATGYELYRFRRLIVRYTPTCSSSTAGVVVGAFDYDASDNPPVSKQALSGYDGAARGNVWNKLSIPARPMAGWYYTGVAGAAASNPSGTDVKMYDMAKFYLGVYNQTAAAPVGELVIEYEIEFAKPDTGMLTGLSQKIDNSAGTLSNLAPSPTVTGNNIFVSTSPAAGQYTLTAQTGGEYLVELYSSLYSGAALSSPFTNITQVDPGSATSTTLSLLESLASAWTNSGTQYAIMVLLAVAVVPGTTITFTAAAGANYLTISRTRLASYKRANA